MRSLLAIDQSTSATKALLFDERGGLLDSVAREHQQFYPRPGWVEHDAEEIWRNVLATTSELLKRNPDRQRDLAGLSLTNQRETVVVFERSTGRPLAPAIVWQCRRGDELCNAQIQAKRGAIVAEKTGLRIDSYFSASKLQWLVRERPEIRAKLTSGEALIGTIDTYLVYRFTGGKVFATDHTNASRTLLFDLGRLAWDAELCAWWEVPLNALPEVRASSARFGETTIEGLLSRPLPICGVMGDSQASLFAHLCFEPGTAKATFGSGSSVLLNVGSRRPQVPQGTVTALAWVYAGVPTYALEGIITYSAATIAWLRDQLGLIKSAEETEALALDAGEDHGVYLVPAFSGLAAPHWREAARGALVGLSAHSDRRHVVRAALESIAYQLRDVLEMMQSQGGVQLKSLRGDGGATANRFLMQFTADMTGVELHAVRSPHHSPLGAALMGALGLGLFPSMEALAALPREAVIYRPTMSAPRVESHYAGWRQALHQVVCVT